MHKTTGQSDIATCLEGILFRHHGISVKLYVLATASNYIGLTTERRDSIALQLSQ